MLYVETIDGKSKTLHFNMAGNVRGAMRPQGRSPPFLLIGLCVALCILGFNYWSLSYRNRELGAQIVDLQDQVRRSMSKRMTAERRGQTVVDELKKCENTLDMEKNEIARKESEVASMTEQLRTKVTEMTDCENKIKDVDEIRTNLKTCEENNMGINQELQKKKDELKAAIQQAPAQDAERCKLCKGQWSDEKKNFLNNIEKVLGPHALMQLHEAGVDIGVYAQEMQKVDPQGNGQALPQGQVNPVNAPNVPVNQPAQEQQPQPQQPQQPQPQPQQPQPQPQAEDQNQIPQRPPVQAQQPVEGQAQMPIVQGIPDNNVLQGQSAQVEPPNPPLVNQAAGNFAETNVLGVNADGAAAKVNGAQSQNGMANNPPPGNPVAGPGGDFVPVANPGMENAGQAVNEPNKNGAEKVAEPAAVNPDAVLNRVEKPPSDSNKTTAGNSLLFNLPLPKDVPSASNLSISSRPPTQSVQTDIQMALHASQSNNTANNQTLDLNLSPGIPIANPAGSNDQLNVNMNAGPIQIDDNPGKLLKDAAAKVRPLLFDNNYNNDFNALQQAAETLHNPNLPQKTLREQLLHPPNPNTGDNEAEDGRAVRFSWLRRDRDALRLAGIQDGHRVFIPNLEGKASDDYNDFRAPLGMAIDSQMQLGGLQDKQAGIVQDEDSIDKMQHNMNMEDDRMNRLKSLR